MDSHFIWNIDPVLFKISFFQLRYYSLLYAGGVLVYIIYLSKSFQSSRVPEKYLDSFFIYMFIGMLVGARMGHVLFYEPLEYLKNPLEILKIWKGGLASHGALIGMVTAVFLFHRKYSFVSLAWLFDRSVLPIFFVGAMIRLGNFFNSEIIGIPGQVPWAIVFERIDNIPRHPVQLYESITYLILGLLGVFFCRFPALKNRHWFLTGYFFTSVFAARIVLEVFKIRQAEYQKIEHISTGQWLSIPIVLIGIFLLVRSLKKEPQPFLYQETQNTSKKNKGKKGEK